MECALQQWYGNCSSRQSLHHPRMKRPAFGSASFSRSKFWLNSEYVSLILASVLGGESSLLSVVEIDQWVFKFCVASSKVGFMIYALKSFACLDFKLHFFLWNESGLFLAKATVKVDHTRDFQWVEVQTKSTKKSLSSFARSGLFTGGNIVPLGSRNLHSSRSKPSVFGRLNSFLSSSECCS